MEDIAGKQVGENLPAAQWNQEPQELQNVITDVGISLTSNDLFQLAKAIAHYALVSTFMVDTGAADAYVVNTIGSIQAPLSYVDGMLVRFRPDNANTGASTLRIGSLAITNLVQETSAALTSGDILTTRDVYARYDVAAGVFFLADFSLPVSQSTAPRSYIDGLIMSNAADAAHDISFSPGQCAETTRKVTLESTSATVKRIDANWLEGTGSGGFPSSLTLAADTWYHCFALGRVDGTLDFGFDISETATALLASATGFPFFRRIGSVLTDVNKNIIPFLQFGDHFLWENGDVGFLDINEAPSTSAKTHVLAHVPPDVTVIVNCMFESDIFTLQTFGRYAPPSVDLSNLVPALANSELFAGGGGEDDRAQISAGLEYKDGFQSKFSQTGGTLRLFVHGWRDFRGKS